MMRIGSLSLAAGAALLTLAAFSQAADRCDLPRWAASALAPGEDALRCDTCGDGCLRLFLGAAGDSLCGNVVRLIQDGTSAARSVDGGWLRPDAADPRGIVEFDGAIVPAEALAAVRAVRPQLKFGNRFWRSRRTSRSARARVRTTGRWRPRGPPPSW